MAHPTRRLGRALPVVLLLAGCGEGAVQVPDPAPAQAAARLCAGLRLPERLHGQERRDVEPASPRTAAWGSPAIALRCGVPRPAALRPASQLVTVNGVDWFPLPPDRPVTFTAVGRQAYVEVTVPPKYHPAGDVLVELGDAVKATLPRLPEGRL